MNQKIRIACMLGWQDIKQAYRRSVVGPFWLTIGMLIQIVTMGLVFGLLFKTELTEYLPFLASSIVIWGLISSTINEGCSTFSSSDAMIRQLNLPHFMYVLRTVWRNLVSTAHNIVILPLVFLFFLRIPGISLIAFVPGVILLVLNLSWVVWLLGIVSARFRDLPPIISSLTTVVFYVTPVMWYPNLIDDKSFAHILLGFNPVYHWIQIVRLPLLGQWPTWENWGLALLSVGIGWAVASVTYKRYRSMIAYWV